MPFIEDLTAAIENRIQVLTGEITALEDARAALASGSSARARSSRPRARRPRRRGAPKATKPTNATEVLLADRAEQLLASTNGLSTAALAKQAGADRDQVLALLRDLEKRARVRRTGQRRATRWHAITDEDRIRERAAELTRRSKRRSE
jgi:hypothetical protein